MKKIAALLLSSLFILGSLSGCLHKSSTPVSSEETVSADPADGDTQSITAEEELSASAETEAVSETHETESISSETLDAVCLKYGALGVSAAVISGGRLTGTYVYGWADSSATVPVSPDTTYRIASLSKLVTETVFMKLCEEGKCSPDEDVGGYLGYEVRNPSYPGTVITSAMLMSHTSSMLDSAEFQSSYSGGSSTKLQTLLSYSSTYSSAKPGTRYSYCNLGVAVVGAVCETVTGMCFNDLAKQYIFDPLGINAGYLASDIEKSENIGHLSGMSVASQLAVGFSSTPGQTHHIVQGGLHISASDYAKILCIFMNDGVSAEGVRILEKESVDRMLKGEFDEGAYISGFGTEIHSDVFGKPKLYVHTGSGFGMYACYAFTEEGDGVVVLTSGASGSKDSRTEIYSICYEIISQLI